MATLCPKLNNMTENLPIITKDNLDQPRLSTYERTVGTTVTLNCDHDPNYELEPNNRLLTCQQNLQWDKAIPTCAVQATTQAGSDLTEEQKMIIGVTAGIGGFILIVLVALICAIQRMQRNAKKKRERSREQPFTEVTSVGSVYALDNRAFGPDRGYSHHPPTYSSRNGMIGPEPRRMSLTLPPPSYGHSAYKNPVYQSKSREEILDIIARERINQLNSDRDRLQYSSHPYGSPETGGRGKRYAKRGQRIPEAEVRAQRTLQYVEEHSNRSYSPPFQEHDRRRYSLDDGYIGQGRYRDGQGQGRYGDDNRYQSRYNNDNYGPGRPDDRYRSLDRYQTDYNSSSYYGDYRDARNNSFDYPEHSRYPSLQPETLPDGLWRPQTKTHYTANRLR